MPRNKIFRPTLPPFVKILPLVVVGIVVGGAVDIRWTVAAIGALICAVVAVVVNKRRPLADIYAGVAIVLTAMATTTLRTTPIDLPYDQRTICTATITSISTLQGHRHRCEARVECEGKVRKVELHADTALHARLGEKVALRTTLRKMPEGSYGRLMERRGVSGRCYVDRAEDWAVINEHSGGPSLAAVRAQERMLRRFNRLGLTGDTEAVCKAMAFGHKGEMSQKLRTNYSRAGASHLLAISGLHVGIVAMLVWAFCVLMPLVGRRGHIWRNVVCSVVMIGYALATGASPSVVRATLMFCAAQLALAEGGGRSTLNILCGALAVMLLANPNNLYDISFTLSAVAVGGILIGYEPLMDRVQTKWRGVNWVWGVVIVGLCSTLATLPLVANTFGVVSLVGVVLNPVVILTANVIVLGSIVWVLLPWAPLSGIVRAIVGGAAELQNRCVEVVSSWEWSAVEVSLPDWLTAVCYVAVAVLIAMLPAIKNEKRIWKEKR